MPPTMGEVVHLIDGACGIDEMLEAAALAGEGGTLLCVGPPPECNGWERLLPAGTRVEKVSPSALLHPASRTARRLARTRVARCWSVSSARALARSPGAGRVGLIVRLVRAPARREVLELRRLAAGRRVVLACAFSAGAVAVRSALPEAEVRVVPPRAGVEQAPDGVAARARRHLGAGEGEYLLAAPGPVHRRSGHRVAAWATAVLDAADVPVRLVLRRDGPARGVGAVGQTSRSVAAFLAAAAVGPEAILVGPEVSAREMLRGARAALFLEEPFPPPVHLALAMAEGVPIVAADTPATREWLGQGESACLVRADLPRAVARALLSIIEDADLAGRIARGARARARALFQPGAGGEPGRRLVPRGAAAGGCGPAGSGDGWTGGSRRREGAFRRVEHPGRGVL